MINSFSEYYETFRQRMIDLDRAIPEAMAGFRKLHSATMSSVSSTAAARSVFIFQLPATKGMRLFTATGYLRSPGTTQTASRRFRRQRTGSWSRRSGHPIAERPGRVPQNRATRPPRVCPCTSAQTRRMNSAGRTRASVGPEGRTERYEESPGGPYGALKKTYHAKWAKALLASAMRCTFSRVVMAAPSPL